MSKVRFEDNTGAAWGPKHTDNEMHVLLQNPKTEQNFKVDSGDLYMNSASVVVLANSASNVLLATPAGTTYCHLFLKILAERAFLVDIFEDVSNSASGTELHPYNTDRNAASVPGIHIFNNPTVTLYGTKIAEMVAATAVVTGFDNKLILKANSNYVFRFTNLSGVAAWVSRIFNWHNSR